MILRTFAVLFVGALVATCQQSPTFKIAGHVIRHADHQPVKGAHVTLAMVGQPSRQLSAISGENGDFLFFNLPPAKYQLGVNNHGWSQLYQQYDGYTTDIAVGPRIDSEHILFILDSPAVITGSVMDDENEPVRGATVYLFGEVSVEGRSRTGLMAQTATGSDGRFHFNNLAPGVYYIAAFGRPWYAQNPTQIMIDGQVTWSDPKPELDVSFPLTYYGGSSTPAGAAPIKLVEGSKAEIQVTLRAVQALHISLAGVDRQPGQPIQASLSQVGPGGALVNIPIWVNGSDVTGVPPGEYELSANLISQNQSLALGSQSLHLSTNTTVQLTEAAKTSVSGHVSTAADLPEGLNVMLIDAARGSQQIGKINPDGHFDIAQIPPGRYAVRLANNPDTYIEKVEVKGGAYANGELELPLGAQVDLTVQVAKGVTKVNGLVTRDKKPVPGAMVLLLPNDPTYLNYIPRDQSDSDGTFTLNWAAPGRYTLVAIDNGRGLQYGDSAVIKPYLEHGQVIDLPLPKDSTVIVEVQHRH
jgi:hypothetical protein